MPDIAKLTYFVGPNLVYCTRTNSEVIVNLTISASNTTGEDIDITSITVTVPRGTGANDLTEGGMSPVSWQESTWKFKVQGDYFRITPVAPVTALRAGQSITFQLKNIKINTEPGTAVIEIEETGDEHVNQVFFPIGKIKSSLNVDVLNVNPPEVKSGDAVTLTWQTTAAASVVLSPGDFPGLQVNGSKTLNPELTTTYTLTAKGEGPDISAQVTVTVPPPTIVKFEPSAHEISAGDTVRLSWEVINAGFITLSPGHEHEELPATGFVDVTPGGNTTYILTARNKALLTVDKHETIKVKPVTIKKFATSPSSKIMPGETVELQWELDSATGAAILLDGINIGKSQLKNGSLRVVVNKETTFAITAQNNDGISTASAKVTMMPGGWSQITSQVPFNNVQRNSLVLNHRQKIWLITLGGAVYNSANGKDWIKIADSTQWPKRDELFGTVFNGKMWLMGGVSGFNPRTYFTDVWCSGDGATWEKVTDNVPWGQRIAFSCFTLGNKMFISGGTKEGESFKNDVWSTPDGVNWQQETDKAFHAGRVSHKTVIFNNMAWAIGGVEGRVSYDIYASNDGKTWVLQPSDPSWKDLVSTFVHCCSTVNGIYYACNDQGNRQLQVHRMDNYGKWNRILVPIEMQTTDSLWVGFNNLVFSVGGEANYVSNPNVWAFMAW